VEDDMAGTTRIPKAELTGVYGALVRRMSRKMLGDVPEPVEVAWHNRRRAEHLVGDGEQQDQVGARVVHLRDRRAGEPVRPVQHRHPAGAQPAADGGAAARGVRRT
jgi:hypothetical protein